MKTLILNTSSSLYFTRIGIIPKLLKSFKLITTEEILQEIREGEELGFKDARIINQYIKDNKIEIKKTKNINLIAKNFKVKEADASVITLAQETNGYLATEDAQIEKICLAIQVNILNSAILTYYLWENKELSDEQAFLLLDLLVKNGYKKEICLKIKEKIIGGKNV